ncbi:hypothetical protein [Desulfolithobacter sp.]
MYISPWHEGEPDLVTGPALVGGVDVLHWRHHPCNKRETTGPLLGADYGVVRDV